MHPPEMERALFNRIDLPALSAMQSKIKGKSSKSIKLLFGCEFFFQFVQKVHASLFQEIEHIFKS